MENISKEANYQKKTEVSDKEYKHIKTLHSAKIYSVSRVH